jgi:hypothetical protein
MLVRIAKLLGKPVGDAVSAGDALDIQAAGSVIGGLADAISEEEFDHITNAFAKRSTVSGGNAEQPAQLQYGPKQVPLSDGGIFDLHFAGEYAEWLAWLAFALEVNFGSFLGVMGKAKDDLIGRVQASTAPAENELKSPSPST